MIAGTVKFYQRHLLVCTGRTEWPARIEEGVGFIQALHEAIQARMAAMPLTPPASSPNIFWTAKSCGICGAAVWLSPVKIKLPWLRPTVVNQPFGN
jgi:hypothetical protein